MAVLLRLVLDGLDIGFDVDFGVGLGATFVLMGSLVLSSVVFSLLTKFVMAFASSSGLEI